MGSIPRLRKGKDCTLEGYGKLRFSNTRYSNVFHISEIVVVVAKTLAYLMIFYTLMLSLLESYRMFRSWTS